MVSKMSSKNVKDAFIRILLDRWENRVSKFNTIPVPAEVIEASNSFVDDSNPVAGFIRQNYKITRKTTDEVQSSSLYSAFENYCGGRHNCSISSKRFKDDMMGITGIGWKRGKRYSVYYGLEAYPDEDE
jgi:hypothetical protein